MKREKLENKTFIFYPEFNGMGQWVCLIVLSLIIGLCCLLVNEFFHITKNQLLTGIIVSIGIVLIIVGIITFIVVKLYIKNFKYVLNGKRLAVESGIISRKMSNLELWRVIDIELTQSTIQLLFGGCTIRLDTDDLSDPVLYIKGLNNKYGRQVFDLINYLVDKATKSRLIIKSKENNGNISGELFK